MFKVDQQQFERNMNGIAGAIQASSSRTVKAKGLNAKDRTLDALNKYVDKPTPFTIRKGAYQSSTRQLRGDSVVVMFSIAETQSEYLKYIFDGGVRGPGDPGTTRKRIWLPTFVSKNKYGGLPAEFIKKVSARIARNKKGKGAGEAAHYGFVKLDAHGHKASGIWKFPGRNGRRSRLWTARRLLDVVWQCRQALPAPTQGTQRCRRRPD
ncbi:MULTISPECIES: hypothetical protein [unclassified Bradyrhizobium]|uniref:hypothetical protein n=1 Tax=unclassified Bradyrhizobium TaxID=2631580 RepID=UPI002FF3D2B7